MQPSIFMPPNVLGGSGAGTALIVATASAQMSNGYRNYALAVLTSVYMMNLIDRGLMGLFIEPIRHDLNLSDTQIGFMTGIAFALFYAVAGIPIARIADRGNRVKIASASIALWGVTVMAPLFVTNFAQMLLARIAAAVGEAGCKPPTYSLVGDYFPEPRERTRAMAIYWIGSPLAALVSGLLGGWLSQHYGWRMAFFLFGIPGILLAIVVWLTISEPRRHLPRPAVAAAPARPIKTVLAVLWRTPALRHLSIGLILIYALATGLAPWYGAFLMRIHGMGVQDLGLWLGLISGFGGIFGILIGGHLSARWFGSDETRQLRANGMSLVLVFPCFLVFLLVPTKVLALISFLPLLLVFNFCLAPTYAIMQRLVPDDMRATTLAVVMLLASLIGMGGGPQIVGILSDLLRPTFGEESLRYAMLAMTVVAFWAAFHFFLSARTVKEDLCRASPDQMSAEAPFSAATTPA